MTDMQMAASAADAEMVAAADAWVDLTREPRMPFGVIVYVVAALSAEALWIGLIGWWLLHLF
jgi:hypothetical protein